jgi:hypothetical protein
MAISPCPELAPDMENRIAEKISATKQPLLLSIYCRWDIKEIQETVKQLDKNIKQRQPLLYYKFDTFKEALTLFFNFFCIQYPMRYNVYKPISSAEFSDKIVILPSGYVDYLVDRYATLNNSLGLKFRFALTILRPLKQPY